MEKIEYCKQCDPHCVYPKCRCNTKPENEFISKSDKKKILDYNKTIINMNLQLSLKTKWFEMTKSGIKTEDYREITEYWIKRLFECYAPEEEKGENKINASNAIYDIEINGFQPKDVMGVYGFVPKEFSQNTMTLGYPKAGDTERIIQLEHAGIEIRTGNTEWGAEPNKLYFVIKHVKRIS